MPRVDPKRHRSQMINFRTTPAVARFLKSEGQRVGENVSDFIREALRLRIEVVRTYADVASEMGFKDPETLVWHAVLEYAKRHAPDVTKMPAMPQEGAPDAQQD